MLNRARRLALGVLVAASAPASPALALVADALAPEPSLVGDSVTFRATVSEAVGAVRYRWTINQWVATGVESGLSLELETEEATHTFQAPGHYSVSLLVVDESGSNAGESFTHLVHHPLTPKPPATSTPIVYDEARKRVYVVNQDSDSVTAIDAVALTRIAEVPVYRRPEALALAPDGKLWVIHRDDYAVAVVDPEALAIERGFRLPYASQPVGLAMSPAGDAAYATLMAVGKLVKLDLGTGNVLGEVAVGPWPRGLSLSHDGKNAYVTRFISPDAAGEVVHVNTAELAVNGIIPLVPDTITLDSDLQGRGLPNYLFSVAIAPDGRSAWVTGKKDNIFRGTLRDGLGLNQDSTVRPITCILDLASGAEIVPRRIDMNDRTLPAHVTFSPRGDYAAVTLAGSNMIEVRDAETGMIQVTLANSGMTPRGTVFGPDQRLFVQGWLSRNVVVYDLGKLLRDFSTETPEKLAEIPTVVSETLEAGVLRGKRIFHSAADIRMTSQGYLTCASCHFEGFEDGRVFDFTSRGEGLRNTTSLLARRGTGQGRIHWSANFDEIQDFEKEIRELFAGKGFLADTVLDMGTRRDPLGDALAGLSPELDDLAAYVASLAVVHPSPFKSSDGSLTAGAQSGKLLFSELGCGFCHAGPDLTDSSRGLLHDVGTLKASSGMRSGEPLSGIDTPTLLGVWETAPYLHDGSAATLRDVLTVHNPNDLHGYVSSLSSEEVDQLVSYLLQLDGDVPVRNLPFDPPPDPGSVDGGVVEGGADPPPPASPSGCACRATGSASESGFAGALAVLVLAGLAVWRRNRGQRRDAGGRWRRFGAVLLLLGAAGCAEKEPPSDAELVERWDLLPPVIAPDGELAGLGSRDGRYTTLCASGRSDPFFERICGTGRPRIGSLAELLKLVGLDTDDKRAFALTGNSTSLVARSVSALNPRLIVFPRVDETLTPPAELIAIGFVRGEQFVEIVSRDAVTGARAFYLLAFEQACSYETQGCDLTSLLSEEIEKDWTAYSIYTEAELENTSFDCLNCHRPGGVGTGTILRMQELASPWMHWFPQRFVQRTDSDRLLTAQFHETHSVDRQYGGIPIDTIVNALDEGSGAQLEALIRAEGDGAQPNAFDPKIAAEIAAQGTSSTWAAQFELARRGEAIAVPYPLVDVTDPAKRAAASQAYRDVVTGAAPREALLDLRDIFAADAPEKLGFVPPPGADGRAVLVQICSRCHDGRGEPSISRSRFNVKELDSLTREQKDAAIARLQDPRRPMPPHRAGWLPDAAREAAIAELGR